MDKEKAGVSLSRTFKMILKLQVGFVGRTHGDLLEPKGRPGSRPHGDWSQGLGQSSLPAIQAHGLLSRLLSAYLQADLRDSVGSIPNHHNKVSHMSFLVYQCI